MLRKIDMSKNKFKPVLQSIKEGITLKKDGELADLLDDRGISDLGNYQAQGAKTAGVSTGFIGRYNQSNYMLKEGKIGFEETAARNSTIGADKRDLLTEYLTSSLYERILKDRAPKIGLAQISDPEYQQTINLKSKFFNEFKTISEFKDENLEEINKGNKINIKGFEKVIAACLFMGEIDYHDENLGVATNKHGEQYAVKIDHGRSGFDLLELKDERSLMNEFLEMSSFYYENINFSIDEFKKAVDEITTISENEIDILIQNRLHNIRKTGFKLNQEYFKLTGDDVQLGSSFIEAKDTNEKNQIALSFEKDEMSLKVENKPAIKIKRSPEGLLSYDGGDGQYKEIQGFCLKNLRSFLTDKNLQNELLEFTSNIKYTEDEQTIRYNNLEKFYTDNLKKQIVTFKEMGKNLDIIQRIDAGKDFKERGWLSEIYEKNQNPVLYAEANGLKIENQNALDWALKQQEDVVGEIDPKDKNGKTALHYAAERGDKAMVTLLVDNGAEVDSQDKDGMSALHYAAQNGHKLIVEKLISTNADFNAKDKNDISVLHCAVQNNNEEIVKLLIEAGADAVTKDKKNHTPLHDAAINKNPKMIKMLIEAGAKVNALDKEGMRALHYASQNGNEEIIDMLLDARANINLANNDGMTALHFAARFNREAAFNRLLEDGAKVNIQDKYSNTALHYASENGNEEMVKLLLEAGADVNAKSSNFNTPLHDATMNKRFPIVKMLIEANADVNAKDEDGLTALQCAVMLNSEATIEALIAAGANVNNKNHDGMAALHNAVQNNNEEIVKKLIEAGADVTAKDNNGETALDLAVNNPKIHALILSAKDKAENNKGIKSKLTNKDLQILQDVSNVFSEAGVTQANKGEINKAPSPVSVVNRGSFFRS
jgi:ankyrin repeat protein